MTLPTSLQPYLLAPFEASQIKIQRAEKHLAELKNEIDAYFARRSVSIVLEEAPELAELDCLAYTYREREAVPPTWSAVIGDVIHNLRSALDLLMCDVHRMTHGKPSDLKYVHYPFCNTKSDLPEMIKSRRLGAIGKTFLAAIHATQPYKDGNRVLRAIHDSDLLDKHQTLLPVVAVVSVPWPVEVTSGAKDFSTQVAHDGQRIVYLPRPIARVPIGTALTANFEILFSDGPFSGTFLVKQLDACIVHVWDILKHFHTIASNDPSLACVPAP